MTHSVQSKQSEQFEAIEWVVNLFIFSSQLLLFIERELIFEWILFNIVSEE